MRYDSECEYSRQHLAISIASRLSEAGFEKTEQPHVPFSIQTKEHVYEREIDDLGLRVQVYTTIVDDPTFGVIVRATGKDAIRVNVKSPDVDRALVKETRINRTGLVEDIVERMIQRARDAYKLGRQSGTCHQCGAPRALSNAGKWYCVKVCWKSDEEKARDKQRWLSKNYKPRRNRRGYFRI